MNSTEEQLDALKLRLQRMQAGLCFIVLLFVVVVVAGFSKANSAQGKQADVLRLRGLIIEDEQGRPRLLLGAPAPKVVGRNRSEPVDGMVLLGPNGADRVVIAYPGLEPQILGKVEKRSIAVPSAGLIINDSNGNERAGFGVSDDGTRVSLGLDYADRDAMGLVVSPNFSGFAAFARNGERTDQITLAVLKDGTSMFKLADSNGDEQIMMEARKGLPPKFEVQNPATHMLQDVTAKLVP